MFINRSDLIADNVPRLHYGIAVTDADADGQFEFLVAGFGTRNLMLKWDGTQYVDWGRNDLADNGRQAIGIAAADIDADGYEEIYILNTDTFSGAKTLGDRLFDYVDGEHTDLFEVPRHQNSVNMTAGRSVAAIDRFGSGKYGFFVANYGGPMRLYELDVDANLNDVAYEAGVDLTTGGRGLLPLPLVTQQMDIFAGNENGANFLFQNNGDGTFSDVALDVGVDDPFEHVRGIAALDVGSKYFALVYGNWNSTHRLFTPSTDGIWDDIAPPKMAEPSPIRTVIAADFDNDGYQEIFFNNIGAPNRLFGFRQGAWVQMDAGDAIEPEGFGTGAAVADLDGDGRLELLVAHGEQVRQPLSLFQTRANDNHWLRVLPKTQYGAPARGAIVRISANGRTQQRVIDAGSGYLCQMEPVAHFGLGTANTVDEMTVRWLDGKTHVVTNPSIDTLHTITYPD
ncbi:MAG: CRTAC1 family protein [Chloroflexota bacterium]